MYKAFKTKNACSRVFLRGNSMFKANTEAYGTYMYVFSVYMRSKFEFLENKLQLESCFI